MYPQGDPTKGSRLSGLPPSPIQAPFTLNGSIVPMTKGSDGAAHVPTRPLGGWMATYGKIGPNGGVIPTEDREGHIFEAARTMGLIDFSPYLKKGLWNDTHTPIHVGVPTLLEFHNEASPLAKAHRKVGFWTEGHLFDRSDPRSWSLYTAHEPTREDLDRADYYWQIATMLKGLPRTLGFSAEGKMLLSPCGSRIIWAQVAKTSVCEVPQNPDTTAIPLALATPVRMDMVGAKPCDTCRCPPGARCPTLRKATTAGQMPVTQDLERDTAQAAPLPVAPGDPDELKRSIERLIQLVMARNNTSRARATRWVRRYLRAKEQQR